MKIAVFGGSFNPLHLGHAMLADTIIKELGFDRILFVPAFIPPHKNMNIIIEPRHRLRMLEAFCRDEKNSHFEVEPCEIQRGGVSYTSDTLEYLTEKYKKELDGQKLYFVMGDEVASEFNKWHKPETVASLADFIITHRYPEVSAIEKSLYNNNPTGTYKGDFGEKFNEKAFGYPCIYLDKPLLPVSSTEVRTRIKEGKSYKYLVPGTVYKYIEENNLYR